MTIHYTSTRSSSLCLSFRDVLIGGLAHDGGLTMPKRWHQLSDDDLQPMSYEQRVCAVTHPYVASDIDETTYKDLIARSYGSFPFEPPLIHLHDNRWILNLTLGPSLAFKDYALQLTANLFDHILTQEQRHLTIVVATSGDTGAAAIHACRQQHTMQLIVLHPHERIASLQRRQMTTCHEPHIHNIAVRGNFDDCQRMVKDIFADARHDTSPLPPLGAMNSINWARIMAQMVYYCHAIAQLRARGRGKSVTFVVPSGNFGNMFAAYAAKRMGMPIDHCLVATNHNDVLARFFSSGIMQPHAMRPSLSPSMDIQTASNFERLLYECSERNHHDVTAFMTQLQQHGKAAVAKDAWTRMTQTFSAAAVDDDQTLATINHIHKNHQLIIDPHTAVAVTAGEQHHARDDTDVVMVATAHPAKFPDAITKACQHTPPTHDSLAALHHLTEQFTIMDADTAQLRAYILQNTSRRNSS